MKTGRQGEQGTGRENAAFFPCFPVSLSPHPRFILPPSSFILALHVSFQATP